MCFASHCFQDFWLVGIVTKFVVHNWIGFYVNARVLNFCVPIWLVVVMPPSPAMRRSPGRELKADSQKRGHSLKSGIFFRENDENLALFDELQSSETDNFLLQSDDDFEDTFATKLSSFSDRKLGTSVPIQGESSDILNVEQGKNDYDWLMTTPDTPLFTFLDDETAAPHDLAQRGRPRSLPISISGSSMIKKSRKSSKGSASPNRLSSSPRSGNSAVQKRGRTYLTPQSSPTPSSQHATPSRRSSPPGKPSQSAPRSSTPTPQRMSTSCIEGSRDPSPGKTSRGNSASPKIRAWQSNIPGFSLEAPPNLRTSLADRPASFVRGSSPASRNGQDSSTRSSRQSLSPTASKSVGSSHSHIRDPLSSHTKRSVASSDNYDAESLLSISVDTSDSLPARRVGSLPNNRAPTFSKKLHRAGACNSTSKRSLDYELRQMDQRKSRQNMFRPLLSSVPSSTFYSGKTSAAHHAIISRNSVTSSSTTSSDLATSGTHYTEAMEQNQDDTRNACVNNPCPDAQDDVFAFDKDDPLNENILHETQDGFGEFDGGGMAGCNVQAGCDIQAGLENQSNHDTAMSAVANCEAFDVKAAALEVDGHEGLVLCSNCGQLYRSCESLEEDLTLCPDCRSDVPMINNNIATSTIVTENSPVVSTLTLKHSESVDAVDSATAEPKSSGVTGMVEPMTSQHEDIVGEIRTSYDESVWNFLSTDFLYRTLVEEGVTRHANQQVVGQPIAIYCLPDGNTGGQQSLEISTAEVDASGGAGISVPLNRSSSCKGVYLQSRSFTASSISYDDPSYVRDNAYSSRVSHGHGSLSALSSVDWGSCRQTNTRLERQSSGRKSDFKISKYDKGATHRRARSSFSGISNHGFQPSGLGISILECSNISLSQLQSDTDVNLIAKNEPALSSRNIEEDDACKFVENNDDCRTVDVFATESSSEILNIDGDDAFKFVENNANCRTVDVFATESSRDILNMHLELSPDTPFTNSEEFILPENGNDLANNRKNVGDVEAPTIPVESSFVVEETMPSSSVEKVEAAEVPSPSLLEMETGTKIENVDEDSSGAQSDAFSLDSKTNFDEATADKDTKTLLVESNISDEKNCTEGKDGSKARSMTPEEVSDTILFCSSIIQKISYDAATIAVENGSPPLFQGSRPMVTILGKKDPERKDPRGRITVKRTSKPQKAEWPVETDLKPPNSSRNDEEITDASETRIVGVSNIGESNMKAPPSKLESKCSCTVM